MTVKNKVIANSFFYRKAELVAPDLIGCHLMKKDKSGNIISGVIVETEAYSQEEASCHGKRRRSPSNESLFGEPGHLYIYLTYGIYHCVNIVTYKNNYANGVLLRSIAIPYKDERIAAGPGLLAKHFSLTRKEDKLPISVENGLWIERPSFNIKMQKIIQTTRIGISDAKDLPWRWYLQKSRSVSKRAKGDYCPSIKQAWRPQWNNQ